MRKKYCLIILLIISIFHEIKACYCISEENLDSIKYSVYDELFLGKIKNIERIELIKTRGSEVYELVGTITTFEIIKKWKGSEKKLIRIYQEMNSCGIDFSITNSRWIISAKKKSFISKEFRRKYPNKYLQTDNCSLYREELDYEAFENDISKLNSIFPGEIILKGNSSFWINLIPVAMILTLIFVYLKRGKNEPTT